MDNDTLGTLSAPEAVLARHDGHPLDNPPDRFRPDEERLRVQLSDQHYEAQEMRKWHERELKAILPPDFDFSKLTTYVDWAARELAARDRMERMGFLAKVRQQ